MHEVWPEIERWQSAGSPVALATVIQVEGSSLRPVASKMAVTPHGEISGSVSGGCVEGAIYEEAQAVLRSGQPMRLRYGVSDSLAWSVGLACGGSIQVYVESLATASWRSLEADIRRCLAEGQLAALATVVAGTGVGNKLLAWPDGRQAGDLGLPALDKQVIDTIARCWHTHTPVLVSYTLDQAEIEVFIDVFAPPPRLVIIGAVHIAISLVAIARAMNFHTIVVDARSAFATGERFPHADELIVEWPSDALEKLHLDPSTYVVCLSHDEKLDNPALQVALDSPARYVGALGSRNTHASRLEALREMGIPEESLARIHAPIGLNLGSRYPEEIALSIMAEIIAVRHGVSTTTA